LRTAYKKRAKKKRKEKRRGSLCALGLGPCECVWCVIQRALKSLKVSLANPRFFFIHLARKIFWKIHFEVFSSVNFTQKKIQKTFSKNFCVLEG
jgi:hypothetical protein